MACLWQIHVMSTFSDILPFVKDEDWLVIFFEQMISHRMKARW